jgi:phage/plasmid primase-like uncharacterized protein
MLAELGRAPDNIEPGRLLRFATNGKASDDAGWCKLFDDLRGGVYGCNRQFAGQTFTWSAVARERLTRDERAAMARQIEKAKRERQAEQQAQWQTNGRWLAQLWGQCLPVMPGDPVARYLANRLKCDPLPLPDCIRLHRDLAYREDGKVAGTWPAMVARLVAPDGRMVALHRTWLTVEGQKAPTPGKVKKLTPTAGPLDGACIRLGQASPAGLGIAEGIETALAARLASGLPTVAAYSAGALAAWQWPRELRRLVIFADADKAGEDAAEALRQRAQSAGLSVEVMPPSTPGSDWCDVWAARDPLEVPA